MTQSTAVRDAQVLANTHELAARTGESGIGGAVWKITQPERDLDANVIALPPGGVIDTHEGPDLDVLIHVLAGSGRLTSGSTVLSLTAGSLVWLPRRSPRHFTAGPDGIRYLTVHRRRQPLGISPAGQSPQGDHGDAT